ncbi:hypothetical protein DSO57_1039365 [Entomophthora muscae]|uniref:Uncharacterized protein n=1 Tax=Entomophthora muscae TaxID=34485 RepID=A0ACC2TWX8_9FUNG|nr:hypothetical protein DSO57_1039365 [Entomophthora muscae]
MKQGLFSFFASSALGNLITCRVPDGNPTNIPEDCQVCQDDIIIEHGMLPDNHLALKQIAGRLIVKMVSLITSRSPSMLRHWN